MKINKIVCTDWLLSRGWELHESLSHPAAPVFVSPREKYDPESGRDWKHAVHDEMFHELEMTMDNPMETVN